MEEWGKSPIETIRGKKNLLGTSLLVFINFFSGPKTGYERLTRTSINPLGRPSYAAFGSWLDNDLCDGEGVEIPKAGGIDG